MTVTVEGRSRFAIPDLGDVSAVSMILIVLVRSATQSTVVLVVRRRLTVEERSPTVTPLSRTALSVALNRIARAECSVTPLWVAVFLLMRSAALMQIVLWGNSATSSTNTVTPRMQVAKWMRIVAQTSGVALSIAS